MSSQEPMPPELPPYPPPPPTSQPDWAYGPPTPYMYPPKRRMALKGDVALKILIGSAVGLVLGFGTCGMGAIFSGQSQAVSKVFVPLGLVLFGLSVVGLAVGIIWLLISVIVGSSNG